MKRGIFRPEDEFFKKYAKYDSCVRNASICFTRTHCFMNHRYVKLVLGDRIPLRYLQLLKTKPTNAKLIEDESRSYCRVQEFVAILWSKTSSLCFCFSCRRHNLKSCFVQTTKKTKPLQTPSSLPRALRSQ